MTIQDTVSSWDIYWLTRLDSIQGFFIQCCILSALAIGGMILGGAMSIDCSPTTAGRKAGRRVRNLGLRLLPIPVILGAIYVFIPTTKEMCAILVIPKIANSEEVQGLGSDLVGLAREWMYELRPKKDSE